jgi:hypothetical protein
VVILEMGGSPMTGTVVKILASNPTSFNDDLQRLEEVSKVTSTSNEMILTSADRVAEGTVTFTFHVELNIPVTKGPLHMAEWPNLAWASAVENRTKLLRERDGSGRLSRICC